MTQIALPLEPAAKAAEPETRNPDSVRLAPGPLFGRAPAVKGAPPPPRVRPPLTIDAEPAPSDSMWRPSLAGWLIIALFFGGFGYWAATAPLHGAVVANGVVKVEGNRKSIQHLDGGREEFQLVAAVAPGHGAHPAASLAAYAAW